MKTKLIILLTFFYVAAHAQKTAVYPPKPLTKQQKEAMLKMLGGVSGLLSNIGMGNPPVNKITEQESGGFGCAQGGKECKGQYLKFEYPIDTPVITLISFKKEDYWIVIRENEYATYQNGAWSKSMKKLPSKLANGGLLDCLKTATDPKDCFVSTGPYIPSY
jgi:hypothetical protein